MLLAGAVTGNSQGLVDFANTVFEVEGRIIRVTGTGTGSYQANYNDYSATQLAGNNNTGYGVQLPAVPGPVLPSGASLGVENNDPVPTPEPETFALGIMGASALLFRRRNKDSPAAAV